MRVELYRQTGELGHDPEEPGGYRWRIWESSDVIGASTEGYQNRADMVHNLLALTGGRLRRIRDELFLVRRSSQRGRLVRFEVKDMTGDDDGG